MQSQTGSLDPRSLVAYNTGFNSPYPAFMPQTFILAFESLEYIFVVCVISYQGPVYEAL